jgi:hypothetical protein
MLLLVSSIIFRAAALKIFEVVYEMKSENTEYDRRNGTEMRCCCRAG